MINNELCRLQVDIVALQETRVPESGIIRERDYSFFWQDKAADETREHGVGFAIKNNLLGSIIPPSEGTERLLKLQLILKHAFVKSTEDIYVRTRSVKNLFKLSRLGAKTRVHEKYVRDLLCR